MKRKRGSTRSALERSSRYERLCVHSSISLDPFFLGFEWAVPPAAHKAARHSSPIGLLICPLTVPSLCQVQSWPATATILAVTSAQVRMMLGALPQMSGEFETPNRIYLLSCLSEIFAERYSPWGRGPGKGLTLINLTPVEINMSEHPPASTSAACAQSAQRQRQDRVGELRSAHHWLTPDRGNTSGPRAGPASIRALLRRRSPQVTMGIDVYLPLSRRKGSDRASMTSESDDRQDGQNSRWLALLDNLYCKGASFVTSLDSGAHAKTYW